MKCPKCEYLGFETGDRCRNCGYDFSLSSTPPADDRDLPLQTPDASAAESNHWQDHVLRDAPARRAGAADEPSPDRRAAPAPARPAAARAVTPPLPLFQRASIDDDAPLIKMPAAPRAPLAVRRTPDKPKLRAAARAARPAPSHEAAATAKPAPEPVLFEADIAPPAAAAPASTTVKGGSAAAAAPASGPGPRLLAAAIDHGLLLAVDLLVVYFTLKMAGLSLSAWRAVPPAPLVAFLLLLKLAYFSVFTILGGQTVGKMAVGIRVVADDGRAVAPSGAVGRALAGVASVLTLGLGFLPVLLSGDRRAIHDRVARTRVIAHP